METSNTYYRPEWTCGRYDREHNVAILYNLIEGMCFYYEDITAEVISCILSKKRNESFELDWLSRQSDVNMTSLMPFVYQLVQYGLLTSHILTEEERTQ